MNVSTKDEGCTGCGACSCVCPKKAISIVEDEYGCLTAKVNDDCIDCGRCVTVCQKFLDNNVMENTILKGNLYAVKNKNRDMARASTSSGLAGALAKKAMDKGYKVVGVIFDKENCVAKSIIVDTEAKLEELKKSKYLQAYTLPAFNDIITQCKQEPAAKFIIFGMPCQINGIKKAVDRSGISNEIIYVDFFCHGVPSYLTWRKYLQENKISTIDCVDFRDKSEGWHNFIMKIKGESEYRRYACFDNFYKAFFDNILLNKTCFTCPSRKGYTLADIRLGDFWGKRYVENNDGVSACLCFNEKGRSLLSEMKEDFAIEEINDKSLCFSAQSLRNYAWTEMCCEARENLKGSMPLSEVIRAYRVKFDGKQKLKIKLKQIIYMMPKKVRDYLKKKVY